MEDSTVIINNLIKIAKDGEEGFRLAAEHVKNSSLKSTFIERAESCKRSVEELQSHAKDYKEEVADEGSIMGMLHRVWINLKSMVTDYDDKEIINECLNGEEVAKKYYEEVLGKDLSPELREVVQKQYDNVVKSYDIVNSLNEDNSDNEDNH